MYKNIILCKNRASFRCYFIGDRQKSINLFKRLLKHIGWINR